MSVERPGVSDVRPMVSAIVTSLRLMGCIIPPNAEKMLELSFSWLLNEVQGDAFRFAADASALMPDQSAANKKLIAAFRSIAADNRAGADKAMADLNAMGKPS